MRKILKKYVHRAGIIALCDDGTLHGWHPVNQCFFPLPETVEPDPGEVPDDSEEYRKNFIDPLVPDATT